MPIPNPLDLLATALDKVIGLGARAAKVAALPLEARALELATGRAVKGQGVTPVDPPALLPQQIKAATQNIGDAMPRAGARSVPGIPAQYEAPSGGFQKGGVAGKTDLAYAPVPGADFPARTMIPRVVGLGLPSPIAAQDPDAAGAVRTHGTIAYASPALGADPTGSIPVGESHGVPRLASFGAAADPAGEIQS